MAKRATKTKRTSKRTSRTPEQLQAEAQALHEALAAQVEALSESEQWLRFLEFAGSFHRYSLNNLLLIAAQRPEATQVAGFRAWQERGRQVRKGERAIRIRGFSTTKVTREDPATGDETEHRLPRFPVLSVFDIAQTDPIEGAEQPPANPAQPLSGDDPAGIYQRMLGHLVDQGWSVTRERIGAEINGYTTTDGTRRIVIEEALSPAHAAKTLIHETAHALMHAENITDADYVAHRGRYETEAESVAYVLAGLLGLDTAGYSVGYITSWARGDVETVKDAAEQVLATVHHLAEALARTDHEGHRPGEVDQTHPAEALTGAAV